MTNECAGRCAAALLLASLVDGASGAAAGWNESIVGVETHRMIAVAGTETMWISGQTKSDVFYVGEQIVIHCLTRTTKSSPLQAFPYTLELLRVAPGASTPTAYLSTDYSEPKAKPGIDVTNVVRNVDILTAHSPGSWKYGCRLVAADDVASDNGPVLQQVMVLPKQPGVAGLLPVPAPQILHPAPGQKFTPSAASPVPIRVRLADTPFGAKPNLVEYAKATGDKETWQLEIVRRGQGTAKGFETTVGKFEGALTAMEFAAETLTADWFAKNGGPGLYAARVWIAQRRQVLDVFNGPSARVDFEIVGPVVADAKAVAPPNQPVLATGSVPGTNPLRQPRDGGAPPLRSMAMPGETPSAAPARITGAPFMAGRIGTCPPGQLAYKSGTDGLVKCIAGPACVTEQSRNVAGQCVCPAGMVAVRHGSEPDKTHCVPASPCAAGLTRDAATGECRCPPGQQAYRSGSGGGAKCIAVVKSCPPGADRNAATGQCQCPPGTRLYRDGMGGGGCAP